MCVHLYITYCISDNNVYIYYIILYIYIYIHIYIYIVYHIVYYMARVSFGIFIVFCLSPTPNSNCF